MTTTSIRTKYIPATDTTGSRIQAAVRNGEFKGKQITIPFSDAARDPHALAARTLIDKLGIVGDLAQDVSITDGVGIYSVVPASEWDAEPAAVETVVVREEPTVSVQAVTRYVGPEGFKGARVGARLLNGPFEGKRVTVGYDYAARDAHAVAVRALLVKVGIVGEPVQTLAELGNGYIYDIAN